MFELVQHTIHRRHFWRHISFSELSELYISTMLRVMALGLVGIFVPVYLYQLGYGVPTIALFFALAYGTRLVIDPLTQLGIHLWGAKHLLRASYLVLIAYLVSLLTLEYYELPLVLVALLLGLSLSSYFLPFHLEFSVLKSVKKEGSQLSWMYALQKFSGAMGPLVGGLVGTYFGFQYVIAGAITLLCLATVPLFLSSENIKPRKLQPLNLLDYVRYARFAPASMGVGINSSTNMLLWPLFIGVYIVAQDKVYAGLGLVITVSLFAAILGAYAFGKLIDKRRGGTLLQLSVIGSFITFLVRPFIGVYSTVMVFNPFNEIIGSSIGMTYAKGFYDSSDSERKKRLSFITVLTSYAHMGRVLFWTAVAVMAWYGNDKLALQLAFVLAGLTTLLLLKHKFKALQ